MSLEGAIAANRFGLGARPGEIARASDNPKAWLMVVSAISAYTAGRGMQLYLQVAIIAVICLIVTFLSTLTWAAFDTSVVTKIPSPPWARISRMVSSPSAARLPATTTLAPSFA